MRIQAKITLTILTVSIGATLICTVSAAFLVKEESRTAFFMDVESQLQQGETAVELFLKTNYQILDQFAAASPVQQSLGRLTLRPRSRRPAGSRTPGSNR